MSLEAGLTPDDPAVPIGPGIPDDIAEEIRRHNERYVPVDLTVVINGQQEIGWGCMLCRDCAGLVVSGFLAMHDALHEAVQWPPRELHVEEATADAEKRCERICRATDECWEKCALPVGHYGHDDPEPSHRCEVHR
jgi:hypothetical protein